MARESPSVWTDRLGVVRRVPPEVRASREGEGALVEFVMDRDRRRCVACGAENEDYLVIDHVLSAKNGGSNHPSNLQVLCVGCNSMKASQVDSLGDDIGAIWMRIKKAESRLFLLKQALDVNHDRDLGRG